MIMEGKKGLVRNQIIIIRVVYNFDVNTFNLHHNLFSYWFMLFIVDPDIKDNPIPGI